MIPTQQANQIRAGDHRAFDRLFEQYALRVLGYLQGMTGDRAEAQDLTQDTFLAAYTGRNGFRGGAQPLTWLFGIARRRWRDSRRHPGIVTQPLDEQCAPADDPAGRIATAVTLADALDRLDPAGREALHLTAVQGLTYAEAARVLGEPEGTIKWRVYQATQQLRRILNAAEERYEATKPNQAARTVSPPCRG